MYKQKGQAMIFGLLFLAVVVMALLVLYNQGQLVTNRIQLENTADATVYSQAKLAARNQNFIAYTNRSMVANEVSIGQMVAILSWAKHYKNIPAFIGHPFYNFPFAPPSPITASQVLSVVTAFYVGMGTGVTAVSQPMVKVWPSVVSIFNGTMGVFQKIFAVATLEAQINVGMGVVEDHEDDPDKPEMYIPVIGWYFFTQNALLTYFGDNFDIDNMVAKVDNAIGGFGFTATAEDLAEEYLGGTMISDNSPGIGRKQAKNSGGGASAHVNTGENAEDKAVEAYHRYAAIVNRNRESFTEDRHWQLWAEFDLPIPRLTLPLGLVTLTIDLDISVGFGIKNDGGTVYVADGEVASAEDIAKLGWSSIDVASIGLEFGVALYVDLELCLPFFGCNSWNIVDFDTVLPFGFPLAGATHQVVSDNDHAKSVLGDWGAPFNNDTGMYGGDEDDPNNNGAFDGFHAQALNWGQTSPSLLPGMYGLKRGSGVSSDVTDTYAAPPSFFSLGARFQESARSYEFTTAIAKSLDDVVTTDHENLGIDSDGDEWRSGNIQYTNFDVQTHSRAEGDDLSAVYQQFIWADDRPMMTISSAETYFKNPMQFLAGGEAEPASLFSPFWDARLREPSAIATLLATGELHFDQVFANLGTSATSMVGWVLRAIGDRLVDTGVDYLLDQIESPYDGHVEDPLRDGASQVMNTAVDGVMVELEDFLP